MKRINVTFRLTEEEFEEVERLREAYGDETTSQTLRRIIRMSSRFVFAEVEDDDEE